MSTTEAPPEIKGLPAGAKVVPLTTQGGISGLPEGALMVPITPQAEKSAISAVPKLDPFRTSKLKEIPWEQGSAQTMAAAYPKGLAAEGNLPIWNRPAVQNADGTHSSEYSTSFKDEDGGGYEVLVPTIVKGKFLTPDGNKPKEGSPEEKAMFKKAWQHYRDTGEHLGKFDNPGNANAYAQVLHGRGDRKPAQVEPVKGIPPGAVVRPVNTLRAGHLSQWDMLKLSAGEKIPDIRHAENSLDQLGGMMKHLNQAASNPVGMSDKEWEENRKRQRAFIEKHLGTGITAGAVTGAAEFSEEMLSPYQMALMFGTLGESTMVQMAERVGIKGAAPAARTLSKLIQAHFTAQMIEGGATSAQETGKAFAHGDWEGAGKAAIESIASIVMARGLVSHELAQEKVHADLNVTSGQMHGKPFDQLNPYDQGMVIDATVKGSPEYREILNQADANAQQGRDQTIKQRKRKLSKYYETAVSKSWNPDAAQRAIDGLQRAGEEDQRHEKIHEVVGTMRKAVEAREKAIRDEQDTQLRAAEQAREEGREERPERRQAASTERSERQKLADQIGEKRKDIYAQRKEAQQDASGAAQRQVEAVQDNEGNVTYPANYWGEENRFGVSGDVTGHGVYRQTPRGVEWLDTTGNFTDDPANIFTAPDPETADTVARLSSLTATADTLADADAATEDQKADAEILAGIRRDLVSGEITTRDAQKQAGIAEKVTLSDEFTAARDGELTGPYHESSAAEYLHGLEESMRGSEWDEADIHAAVDEAPLLARQQTESNLNHVYQPGDHITSKRGVRWTLDSKGMLHPNDGGPAVPMMRNGFYSNQAVQLAESGKIGYGTETREERRAAFAKRREINEAISRQQEEVDREVRMARQSEGLQMAEGEEPRADVDLKNAREQRRMSRPPRAPESPTSQLVRMIFKAPSKADNVINAIARQKETTPEEVMRLSLATDPAMSGTVEQKVAGLEPGDRILEPIRKKPWVVEKGKDGETYLRSGNAQPIRLDRLNPSDIAKGIIQRGEIQKDVEPADIERVAFANPHYVRWQDDQAAAVNEIAAKPLPEPITEKQKVVQVQAASRRAQAAESVATKALVEAVNDPKPVPVEESHKQVEEAQEKVKTAEEGYAQAVEAKSKTEPEDQFKQVAPISIGLKGETGTMVQNNREVPFHYELVPIDALTTSHEWRGESMIENPLYPSALQPRTISETEAAQNSLRAMRGKYDFRQYADKTINGSMGPAIVDAGGQVIGGNTRIAILRKHLAELQATGDVEEREAVMAGMKARMRQLALDSGIARYPEDGKMYVVVRMMEKPIETTREAAELGRLFNKKVGVEIGKAAKGVSYSKSLDPEILHEIGRLVDAHDGIAAAIASEPDFFNKIVTDRFDVGPEEEADWFREIGNDDLKQKVLSEDGRNQFTKALLGTVVKDTSILSRLQGKTPYIALERALAYIVKMGALPEMNITPKIVEAMQAASDTDGTNPGLSEHSDKWWATYKPSQVDFLGMEAAIPPEPDRMTEAIWRALQAGNRTLNDRLKSFIGDESTAAMSMFAAEQETPTQAFNRAFEKELRASAHLSKRPVELTPTEFQAALENRDIAEPESKEVAEKKPEQVEDAAKESSATKPEEKREVPKGITRPPKGKTPAVNLADTKAKKGYVTPEELKTFLDTNPVTKENAPELLRTAKLMAEYVYDANPPVGTDRKDALAWVLRERLAGIESGERKDIRGEYSDPLIEEGFGTGIMKLHRATTPDTFIHEFAHVVFPLLSDDDLRIINRINGDTHKFPEEWDGQRGTLKGGAYASVSEKFSHGLEQFLRDENPTGFTHEVKAVLAKIKAMMQKVYMAFRGDPLSDFKVDEEQREIFSKMFGITDFDVADDWRKVTKEARAQESRLKKPSEEKHPLAKLASEMGAKSLSNGINGKVVDTVGERVDPRKPTAVLTFDSEDALMAAWPTIGTKGSKIADAELIEGSDGDWGIRFNTKSRIPPDILQQSLPERHPGVELEDLEKRLRETPAHKLMERRLLQMRVDNLRNKIRAQAGVEEAAPKSEPGLAKAVAEEVKSGNNSRRATDDGLSRNQDEGRPRGISKPPLPRLPRNDGAGRERGEPARGPLAGVSSLAQVKPVELVPLGQVRGAPVGTVRGEPFDHGKWTESLKRAGLPENAPPPTHALDPKTAALLIYPGQKQIVQMAMSALDQGDGFITASATGTGKTYTAMATVKEFRNLYPDARILHLTKNRGLLKDAVKVAANSFGFELDKDVPESTEIEPGVYGATHIGNLNNKIYRKIPWDLVLVDESGEFRNSFRDENKVGKAGIELTNGAKKVAWYSATPFHSPMEYSYLGKLNLWPKGQFDKWIQNNFAHEKIGDKIVAKLDPSKQAKLRQQLIERGQLVSQAISYEGFNAHFGVVPVTDQMKRKLDRVREGFARARDQFVRMGKKGMAEKTAAFEATYTKALLERERLPQAIELAKKARAQGWQVLVFSETSADDLFRRERTIDSETKQPVDPSTYQQLDDAMGGTLSKIIPPFGDVYENLREEFGSDIVDYSGRGNTMASRDAAKSDFLTGKAPMLYTTFAAGGIGVSLHDADYPDLNVKGGDKPRVAIYLGPPYSGVLLEQAIGRPWRFGTKSDVHAVFLATDSEPDIRLMQTKVGPRLRALRAAVLGEKDSLASVMQSYTDEQKVAERQNMLAYAEGDEQEVSAANYQVRSKGRDVGINEWSQINFPAASDAMHKGMKYGEEVNGGGDWSKLFQSKYDGFNRPPDSPENKDAKEEIDRIGNAAVSGKIPEVRGMEPADRDTAVALAAANATTEVDINVDRDKDNTALDSMKANLKDSAHVPYHGIMLTQEQGMVNIARMDGKPEIGYDLRRMNRSYRADWDTNVAQSWNLLADSLERNGFDPEPKDEVMRQVWDVVEGKKTTDDPKIQALAADVSDMMALAHDDLGRAGVRVKTKGGEQIPYTDFDRDPHYMPHRIDWDYEMVDPKTNEKVTVREFLKKDEIARKRIIANIPELRPYSYEQIMSYLRKNDPKVPAQGNIHYAREVNFPFIKKDYSTLLGYFNQVGQAISAAKNFGANDSEILRGKIRKIGNVRGQATLQEMFNTALLPQDWSGWTGKMYNAAVTWEAFSKMTFSTLKVPFHLVLGPVALHGRVMPHVKAFARYALDHKEVKENAAYVGTLVRQMNSADMMFGEHSNAAVRQLFRREGFEAAYRMVRTISGEAARVYMDQYAMKDLKKGGTRAEEARRLLKDVFLIGDHGIDEAVKTGRFSQEDLAKGQTAFTNQSAFSGSGDPIQMPGMARMEITPLTSDAKRFIFRTIRLTYALQSFSVKAMSLLREHLWDEVMVHGNKKPLMYAMIAFPIVGTLLQGTGTGGKHLVQRGMEKAFKTKHHEDTWDKYLASLKDTFEHPEALKFLKWYIDSWALSAGAEIMKTLADPLLNMAMGKPAKQDDYWSEDLWEHAVGSFFGDLGNIWSEERNVERIAKGKKHPELKKRKFEKVAVRTAAEVFPALRTMPWVRDEIDSKPKK